MQGLKYCHSLNEFAEANGISRGKVYKDIREGKLQARKIGRRTVILVDDAKSYLNALPVYVPRQEPSKPRPLNARGR